MGAVGVVSYGSADRRREALGSLRLLGAKWMLIGEFDRHTLGMSTPGLLVPRKLRAGDTIRVVAPARSRAFVAESAQRALIDARFAARADADLRRTCG